MTIEEMKEWKRKIGFTNARLATVSGVPVGTVNKIFSGDTKNPRLETMVALEKALLGAEYYKRKANDTESHANGTYDIQDYYALQDDVRVELIDGAFYEMPVPTTGHQRSMGKLWSQIQKYIDDNGGDCEVFFAPVDVKLDQDNKTMVQPDVMIVCDPDKVKDWGIEGAPDFVIEVLSPSTKRKDMYIKAAKYSESGVKEYWMVDLEKERVIINIFDEASDEDIRVLGLEDEIPVWIYNGELKLNLKNISKRE